MDTILIFAGGTPPPPEIVEDLPRADFVVAADGGYDIGVELGYRIDVLVGDFDSVSKTEPELPDHVIVERYPRAKDATDLELALRLVRRESPSRLVVVGASGGRLDHELAAAGLLCSDEWGSIDEIDWISARAKAYVVRGRRIVHGDVGSLVTLIPMHGDATGVTTKGLRWHLDDETLSAGTTRGVSNILDSPIADIKVREGCLLAVLTESAP